MALTTYTITITNQNTDPRVIAGTVDTTVISPTGITTPQTPFEEYISDSQTINDGSILVPLFQKFFDFKLKASSILTLATEDSVEAAYYSNLKLDGALVAVTTDPVVTVSVTLSETTAEITTNGGTKALSATTTPASGVTVTWASSDESVATVSSGTVTAVGNGTAVITATGTIDGVTAIATCTVTVSGQS